MTAQISTSYLQICDWFSNCVVSSLEEKQKEHEVQGSGWSLLPLMGAFPKIFCSQTLLIPSAWC